MYTYIYISTEVDSNTWSGCLPIFYLAYSFLVVDLYNLSLLVGSTFQCKKKQHEIYISIYMNNAAFKNISYTTT